MFHAFVNRLRPLDPFDRIEHGVQHQTWTTVAHFRVLDVVR